MLTGNTTTLGARRAPAGEIHTDLQDLARLLRNHWSQVFSHVPLNTSRLNAWLDELLFSDPPNPDPECKYILPVTPGKDITKMRCFFNARKNTGGMSPISARSRVEQFTRRHYRSAVPIKDK